MIFGKTCAKEITWLLLDLHVFFKNMLIFFILNYILKMQPNKKLKTKKDKNINKDKKKINDKIKK